MKGFTAGGSALLWLYLWLTVGSLYGYSVTNLSVGSDSILSEAASRIENYEPYTRFWTPEWNYAVSRKEIQDSLTTLSTQLNNASKSPKRAFLKALIWHNLYQLEVDSARWKADSLLTSLLENTELLYETLWLQGVHYIKTYRIAQGFMILDRLRIYGQHTTSDSVFLKEYQELSRICFLPPGYNSSDSLFVLPENKKRIPVFLSSDERVPRRFEWEIKTRRTTAWEPSNQLFSADFFFSQQFNLSIEGLQKRRDISLTLNIPEKMIHDIPPENISDPFKPIYRTRITIAANPLDNPVPLRSFMTEVAKKDYDVIELRDDLADYGAISLQCKVKSPFKNYADEIYRYVAFDRYIKGPRDHFYLPEKELQDYEPFPVRYLIAMETNSAVKDKAESMLQGVIQKFILF